MKRRVIFGTLFAAFALLFGGCIYSHSGVNARKSSWQVGVTTCRDVVAAWGNPDSIQGEEWIWKETKLLGGKVKGGYMGICLTFGNTASVTYEHRLVFDASGRLLKQEAAESVPGGVHWNLNPFGQKSIP